MPEGPPPVIPVKISARHDITGDLARYEFVSPDGEPLPAFEAGAHVDVVVAPEFFRQYSLAGDPADRSKYVLGILREAEGRGGSKLLHRIFEPGRRVFISPPHNHFPLHEDARKSLLIGGGIGITPLISMAHRLHALGGDFALAYCAHDRETAGFQDDIAAAPWAGRAEFFFSKQGSRADLPKLVEPYRDGFHLYTCGPDAFMDAVFAAAQANGWPEEALHREYFSVPEEGEWINHPFRLTLVRSDKSFEIPEDKSATQVLAEAGIIVPTKCSDGICGVCKTGLVSGSVEHRDYVLTKAQRETSILLCCSRAAEEGGEIVVDL